MTLQLPWYSQQMLSGCHCKKKARCFQGLVPLLSRRAACGQVMRDSSPPTLRQLSFFDGLDTRPRPYHFCRTRLAELVLSYGKRPGLPGTSWLIGLTTTTKSTRTRMRPCTDQSGPESKARRGSLSSGLRVHRISSCEYTYGGIQPYSSCAQLDWSDPWYQIHPHMNDDGTRRRVYYFGCSDMRLRRPSSATAFHQRQRLHSVRSRQTQPPCPVNFHNRVSKFDHSTAQC